VVAVAGGNGEGLPVGLLHGLFAGLRDALLVVGQIDIASTKGVDFAALIFLHLLASQILCFLVQMGIMSGVATQLALGILRKGFFTDTIE
jgi:hypothetical protein